MKKFKRVISAITASAIAATLSGYMSVIADDVERAKVEVGSTFEAEDLTLNGLTVWTEIYQDQFPGYSGEGFVYLTSGNIEFEVDVEEDGMYELSGSYVQILDKEEPRQQTVEVNGSKYTVLAPYANEWSTLNFGRFRLKKGTNIIKLLPEYGYAAFDTLTLKKAEFPDLSVSTATPCDKNATPEVKGLMKYLGDIYGSHMLSGQQEIYGGGHTQDSPNGYSGADLLGYESEFEWIKKNFGVYPAIRGFDLMNYNPLYGWDDGSTERIIEWGKKGGIPTVCWHINLPTAFDTYEVGDEVGWEKCSYEPNDKFKVANATVKGTKEYEYVQLATKLLAEQLLKVQEENIPVIFRPYHEAEGNTGVGNAWFWWGQEGAEPYKALWKQLYTTLTEEYGLHNLIWEFNSYTYATSAPWYPGDDYVDIVGFDKYNTTYNRHDGKTTGPNEDAISDTFYTLVELTNGKKMVSMPENDTVPSLSNIMVEKAYWLYFCIWYDNGQENFLSGDSYNDPETLKEMYQSDFCITLDELPDDWATYGSGNPKPTDPTEPDDGFIPGDVTGDKKINVFDSVALKRDLIFDYNNPTNGILIPRSTPADVTGDGLVDVSDLVLLNKFLTGEKVTFKKYVEPKVEPQ